MALFTGKEFADIYKGILNISNDDTGLTSTKKTVQTAEGTDSKLQLSTTAVNVVSGFELGGVAVTTSAVELNYLYGTTLGTAVASKVLACDSSKDLDLGTGDLTATLLTGTLQTAAQTNITSVGTLTSISTTGELDLTGADALIDLNPASVGSRVVIDITPTAAISTNEAHWDGIKIDGSALDPSGDDVAIHGIDIDLSGVVCTGANPYIEGQHIEMPFGCTAVHIEEGELHMDTVLPSTAASVWTGIDMVIDVSALVASSKYHAIDVAASGGLPDGEVTALGTHTGITPIHQRIASFTSPSQTEYAGRKTGGGSSWADGLNGIEVFVANSDEIYIGNTAGAGQFDAIEIIMTTPATKRIIFTSWYNTAADSWTQFYPEDDSDGFQQSGLIRWGLEQVSATWTNNGDPGGDSASTGYWIKLIRTSNPDPGAPTPTTMKTGIATDYWWDSSGNLSINGITTTGITLGSGSITMTGSIADTTNRVSKGWFADIESTNEPTIGGNALATIYAAIAQTFYIGSTQVAINRASATLDLAGIGTLGCGTITTSGDLTITGSIASSGSKATKGWFTDLEITNDPTINGTAMASIYAAIAQTFYIGSTQVAINRASATLDLAGIGTFDCGTITTSGTLVLSTNSITMTGSIAGNTNRVTKLWVTDIDCTNTITGSITGTAAIATTVTITDNESQSETNAIIFTASGDKTGGNLALESDGDLTYNPNSGTLATTILSATTVAATTVAGTLSTATQGNITSVGTLTSLSVGAITSSGTLALSANNITMTGTLGTSGSRLTKGWFIDLQVTSPIAGSITGNAVTFTCVDNESESLACHIVFVDGATGSQGAETDGDFTYNPSTGTIAATNLTGILQTATQTNITSVGALGGGSITNGFGTIDIGADNLTATGTVSLGATSFNDNNLTDIGTIVIGSNDRHPMLGYATGVNVIRIQSHIEILNGTNDNTIKCQSTAGFNSSSIGQTDNISKGTTTSGWTLDAGGTTFTIENSILEGVVVGVISAYLINNTTGTYYLIDSRATGGDIELNVRDINGAAQDITSIVDGGGLYIKITYITSS